ncbi:hypothetical protein I3271_03170 [Photobacterium leiognathi]|uniref:flagellar basal body protein n=1 Tax=Photobacterium leiognathi TaxID=553611 RepID=UPI001EE0409C|nr:flagellar basal body protein [Photobacterium leiognathi]MCG3883683.1 hypothetical protein [Photobacterium leiognathi]
MDNSLYIAMSAAKQGLMQSGIVAQNVANANTVGFKSDHAEFQPLFAQMTNTINDTAYSQLETLQVNTDRGTYRTTGLNQDLSARDGYWISVQLPDNSIGYISTATTVKDKSGTLRTSQGLALVGESGAIKIPNGTDYKFNGNGDVTVRNGGNTEVLDKLKLVEVNGRDLVKGEYGVLVMKEDSAKSATDTSSAILPGVLENSNVNSMAAMANH